MPFPYLEIPCTTIEVKIRIREVFIAENRKKGKGRIFKIFLKRTYGKRLFPSF